MLSETVSNELSEKLNKILDNRVKKIEFNNKVYLLYGRKRNSIGYLVRDMIEMYAKETGVSLNDLKEKLSLKVWLNPWGDVIITNNTPERPDQFYMKEEEKVKLSDDTVYVARYWTTDDALEIAKLLGQEIKVLA